MRYGNPECCRRGTKGVVLAIYELFLLTYYYRFILTIGSIISCLALSGGIVRRLTRIKIYLDYNQFYVIHSGRRCGLSLNSGRWVISISMLSMIRIDQLIGNPVLVEPY